MGTKIDTGYEEAQEYMDAIPRGEYTARVSDVVEEESSSGNPMLVWDFEILDEYPGATVRGWTSLLGHALGECKKYWRALGLKPWKRGDDLEKIARKTIGKKKVRLVVGVRRSYDRESGEERENNKINAIFALDEKASKKRPPKKTKNTGRDEDEGSTDEEEEDDDDIPF